MQWWPVLAMCLKLGDVTAENAEVKCFVVAPAKLGTPDKGACETRLQAGLWRYSLGARERLLEDTAGLRGACFERDEPPTYKDAIRRLKQPGDEM